MKLTASHLRANIYRILDAVVENGEEFQVIRKNRVVKIIPEQTLSKLDRLKKRKTVRGRIDNIFKVTWEREWSENK